MKKLFFLAVLGTALLISACANPQKLLESGNYNASVEVAIRKLTGKNKKEKHVRTLELAFNKAHQDDLRTIERLKLLGSNANWGKINGLYREIDNRQRAVEPFLPLIADNGYKADFRFVRLDEQLAESREKAAAQHYVRALDLIAQGKAGDRFAARKAVNEIDAVQSFIPRYKESGELLRQARIYGTTHVLVEVKQHRSLGIPRDIWREVQRMDLASMDREWTVFHEKSSNHQADYHYAVEMRIKNIEVSPERLSERSYLDTKEIEDGFEYVLDDNGNVSKDSLGNDITVPHYKRIHARVLEVYQEKQALVNATLIIREFDSKRTLESTPLFAEVLFSNYASTFDGDRQALSAESKQRIGNQPLAFPPNQVMLADAFAKIKAAFRQQISRQRALS